MADLKISATTGETGGPAETADEISEYLRKDGVYAVPSAGLILGAGAAENGYLAETCPLGQATTTFTTTTTDVYVRRFFAPQGALTSYADIWCTGLNGGTITHAYAALYDMTGARLAVSSDIEAAFTGTGLQTFTWTTPYELVAGTYYYVAYAIADTSDAPSLLAQPTAAGLNANLTGMVNYGTYSTSTTIPSSLTTATLVSDAATTTPAWVGIR